MTEQSTAAPSNALEQLVNQQQQQPSAPAPQPTAQPTPNPSMMPQQATASEGEDFLADLGLDNVPDGVKNGRYPAVLAYGSAGYYEPRDEPGTRKRRVSFAWRIDDATSPHNGETIENDFCHANPGMDNKARRKLRDRLFAIGIPFGGLNDQQLSAAIAGKKGSPVWIEVYTSARGDVNVSKIGPRDASITAQMQQGAMGIAQQLQAQSQQPTGQPTTPNPVRNY